MNEIDAQRAKARTAKPLQSLRRAARKIAKASGCTHMEALHALARERGAKNWAELKSKPKSGNAGLSAKDGMQGVGA